MRRRWVEGVWLGGGGGWRGASGRSWRRGGGERRQEGWGGGGGVAGGGRRMEGGVGEELEEGRWGTSSGRVRRCWGTRHGTGSERGAGVRTPVRTPRRGVTGHRRSEPVRKGVRTPVRTGSGRGSDTGPDRPRKQRRPPSSDRRR